MPLALRLRLEVYYRIGFFLLMQSSPARGGSGIKGLEATGNDLVFARAKRFCRVGCRGDRPGPRDTQDHPLFSGRKTRPVGRSEKGAYVNLAVNAAYPHKPPEDPEIRRLRCWPTMVDAGGKAPIES